MSRSTLVLRCQTAATLGALKVLWLYARPTAAPVTSLLLLGALWSDMKPRGRAIRRAVTALELAALTWFLRAFWRAHFTKQQHANHGLYFYSKRPGVLLRAGTDSDSGRSPRSAASSRRARSRSRDRRMSGSSPKRPPGSMIDRIVRSSRLRSRLAAYERTVTPIVGGVWRTVQRRVLSTAPVREESRGRIPPRFRRITMPVRDSVTPGETFATDWLYPSPDSPSDVGGIVVLLPGIGGGSASPYVHETVRSIARIGWASCVVNYRGLGSPASPSVASVADLPLPYDTSDLHVAIANAHRYAGGRCEIGHDRETRRHGGGDEGTHHRSTSTSSRTMRGAEHETPIIVIGFSLGAITVGKYFAATRTRTQIPKMVVGGIAVSGAFKLDFVGWDAYRDFWQQMIVPNLVGDLIERYYDQLNEFLTPAEIEKATASRDYESMVNSILLPLAKYTMHRKNQKQRHSMRAASLGEERDELLIVDERERRSLKLLSQRDELRTVPRSFHEFQAMGESSAEEISAIDRPFLFLTSLDDPLHHPGERGACPTLKLHIYIYIYIYIYPFIPCLSPTHLINIPTGHMHS